MIAYDPHRLDGWWDTIWSGARAIGRGTAAGVRYASQGAQWAAGRAEFLSPELAEYLQRVSAQMQAAREDPSLIGQQLFELAEAELGRRLNDREKAAIRDGLGIPIFQPPPTPAPTPRSEAEAPQTNYGNLAALAVVAGLGLLIFGRRR